MATNFSAQVLQFMPRLKSFARHLCRNSSMADDLVQETVLRALVHADQFTPGTNLMAWLSVILRNCYFNECRSARHLVSLDSAVTLPMPSINCPQESRVNLTDMGCRFTALPPPQRQALTLVAAQGHSYEHAAELAGCAVGTMKSRVSRGRDGLQDLLKKPAPLQSISHHPDYDHLEKVA